VIFIASLLLFNLGYAQSPDSASKESFVFYISEEVTNANEEDEKQIIQLWKDYLMAGNFEDPNSPYWSFEQMKIPDEYLWAVGIPKLKTRDYQVQCKVIGVFAVNDGYFCLQSSFMHKGLGLDEEIHLDAISTVYAKKYNGKFLLVSSAEYYKTVLEHHKVGSINYYVHPFHKFDKEKAQKMHEFNQFIAKELNVEPMEFDYFVANNSRDIVGIWGYHFMNRMFEPVQTGGVASVHNKLIYAGNNSEYYAHELVHLYTFDIYPEFGHFWLGEGIATFFGGSNGETLDWHLGKLKGFIEANPDYDLSNLDNLEMEIPNGEYKSDFRYVIGGFIIKKVYDKYGISGIFEALRVKGNDNHNSFFNFLEEKLEVNRNDFQDYIKGEIKKLDTTMYKQ